MTEYQRINLELVAFDPQKADSANSELINSGKLGVHELVQNDWVTTEITEDEISLYFLCFDVDFDLPEIEELNDTYSHYPFVVLK